MTTEERAELIIKLLAATELHPKDKEAYLDELEQILIPTYAKLKEDRMVAKLQNRNIELSSKLEDTLVKLNKSEDQISELHLQQIKGSFFGPKIILTDGNDVSIEMTKEELTELRDNLTLRLKSHQYNKQKLND